MGATEDKRPNAPALDAILGRSIPVLDDGFVRVIDYLGGDQAIVQAARISYGTGTKQIREDRGLIRYLMRHRHTSPFEMCELKLHVRVPMDTWRQWIRHRTASVNEYSTRYSIAINQQQRTPATQWRLQDTLNRQGSAGFADEAVGQSLSEQESEFQQRALVVYEQRLACGIAREQARKDLPLSTYTEAYWKIDLHNLLHFLELRLGPYAQVEIRTYAEAIAREIVAKWCPLTWEAFEDYRLHSATFSRPELSLIALLLQGDTLGLRQELTHAGWLRVEGGHLAFSRELRELDTKLSLLKVRLIEALERDDKS